MARNFTITTPSETVRVGPDGKGEMTFTVTNVSGFPTRGLAKIVPQGNTSAEWLTLAEVEREFPAGGVNQFRVAANIPPGTPPGRYAWRFDMVSAIKSGEGSDLGPVVAFEVAPAEQKKKGIPWWVWLAILIGAIVIAVAAWLVMRPKPKPPEVTKVKVPDVVGSDGIAAALALERAGLDPDIEPRYVALPGTRLDKVEDQDPDADVEVEKGATVRIFVVQKRGIRPRPDRLKDVELSPAVRRSFEKFDARVERGQ